MTRIFNILRPLLLLTRTNPLLLFPVFIFSAIAVKAQTKADFTINTRNGCVPLSGINFTDASGGGTVIRRDWDLGNATLIPNGGAIIGTNYLTAQTFTVKLTATFSNGDVKIKTDSIVVYPRPLVDFSTNDTAGCVPHNALFRDLSTTATGTVSNWTWDFGAGGSTDKLPAFTYNTAGNYNISLIVKNSRVCESNAASKFQYIRVYSQPSASFSPSPAVSCNDTLTVAFGNTTFGGSPAPASVKWYFNDNGAIQDSSPVEHIFTAPNDYAVSLVAYNAQGCADTLTKSIHINPALLPASHPTG